MNILQCFFYVNKILFLVYILSNHIKPTCSLPHQGYCFDIDNEPNLYYQSNTCIEQFYKVHVDTLDDNLIEINYFLGSPWNIKCNFGNCTPVEGYNGFNTYIFKDCIPQNYYSYIEPNKRFSKTLTIVKKEISSNDYFIVLIPSNITTKCSYRLSKGSIFSTSSNVTCSPPQKIMYNYIENNYNENNYNCIQKSHSNMIYDIGIAISITSIIIIIFIMICVIKLYNKNKRLKRMEELSLCMRPSNETEIL